MGCSSSSSSQVSTSVKPVMNEESKSEAMVAMAQEPLQKKPKAKQEVKQSVVEHFDVNFQVLEDSTTTGDEVGRRSIDKFAQILSNLPPLIAEHLNAIQQSLKTGHGQNALVKLREIVDEFNSARYCRDVPISIYHENRLWKKIEPISTGTTRKKYLKTKSKPVEQDVVQDDTNQETIDLRVIQQAAIKADADKHPTNNLSRRINQWRPLSKFSQSPDQSYIINVHAVTSIFVLNAGPKLPAKITATNVSEMLDFLRISIDLGGFPFIEPRYEQEISAEKARELRYLVTIQNELLSHNSSQYEKGLLHVLAEEQSMSQAQLECLRGYLRPDSFQRVNWLQHDSESRTPLALAFERRNHRFILEALANESSVSFDFLQLISSESWYDMLTSYFGPPAFDQLSRKRQEEKNPQLKAMVAIRDHLSSRKDLPQMLQHLSELNMRMMRGLDKYGSLTDRQFACEKLGKYVYSYYSSSLYPKQKWLCDQQASTTVKTMPLHDQIMISMFGSVLCKLGFPVIAFAASASLAEIRLVCDTYPGIAFLLKHQFTTAIEEKDSGLMTVKTEHKLIFDEAHSNISAFNLAVLYQPDEIELHKYLADAFQLNLMYPEEGLDTLVHAGEAIGTKSSLFTSLFKLKPWLQASLPLEDGGKVANETADRLVLRLGKALIMNYDTDKFEAFTLTLRDRQVQPSSLVAWVECCIHHFNPACLVPLFAIFVKRLEFTKQIKAKPFGFNVTAPLKPHLRLLSVTREQVDLAASFYSAIARNNPDGTNTSLFFDAAKNSELTDRFVEFIRKHGLIDQHFAEIDTEQLSKYMQRNRDKMLKEPLHELGKPITDRFKFFVNLMKYCSVKTTISFVQSQFSDRIKFGKFTGLLPYLLINSLLEAAQNEEPPMGINRQRETKAYKEHFKRRASVLLPKLLDNAICFPSQTQLLRDSQTDQKLSQEIADRLGVDVQTFNTKCAETLTTWAPVKAFKLDQLYPGMTSALVQQDESVKALTHPQDHLRISKTTLPPMFNAFYTTLLDQKMSGIFEILKAIVAKSTDLSNYVAWLRNDTRENESNFYFANLFEIARPQKRNNYYHSRSSQNENQYQAFLLTARLELIIGARQLEECLESLRSFPDEVMSFKHNDQFGITDCFEKHSKALKFLDWYESFMLRTQQLMMEKKGSDHTTKTCIGLMAELMEIVGDNLPIIMKAELIIEILNARHKNDEWEEHSVQQTIEKLPCRFTKQFTGPALGKADQYRTWDLSRKTVSPASVDEIRPMFDSIMPLITKHFDSLCNFTCTIRDHVPAYDLQASLKSFQHLVALWFSLMTPSQLETVMQADYEIFKFRCTALSYQCLSARNEVGKATLIRLLEKMLSADFHLEDRTQAITSTKLFEMIDDLPTPSKLLHALIQDGTIFNRCIQFSELPQPIQAQVDASHLIVAIASPFRTTEHANFITTVLHKLSDVSPLLQLCPRLFTYLATHQGKNKPVMEAVMNWVSQNNADGKSALELELEGLVENEASDDEPVDQVVPEANQPANDDQDMLQADEQSASVEQSEDEAVLKNEDTPAARKKKRVSVRMVCEFIAQARYDLVFLVREHASQELWAQLINERHPASNSSCIRHGLSGDPNLTFIWDDERYQDLSAEEETYERERAEFEKQDHIRPFFMALNQARFDLCRILQPSDFGDLTFSEYGSLVAVVSQGLNPLTIEMALPEYYKKLAKLQDWLSLASTDSAQSYGLLQLLAVLPGAVALVKHASAMETVLVNRIKKYTHNFAEVDEYMKKNTLNRLILEEAAQDVQVLRSFVDIGLLSGNEVFKDAFTLHMKRTHIDAQKFFFELLAAFPVNGLDFKPAQLPRDAHDPERSGLAAIVEIADRLEYDTSSAYRVLLHEYSHDFLQERSKVEISQFFTFDKFQKQLDEMHVQINQDNEENGDDDDEEAAFQMYDDFVNKLRNEKRQVRKKLLDSVQNLTIISNVFASKAQDLESFIQHFRETVESADLTCGWKLPREVWTVNHKFQAKTTNDISSFAHLWLDMLFHFKIPFEQVLPEDAHKVEYMKLMANLRTDSFEKSESLIAKMLKYDGVSLQLCASAQKDAVPGMSLLQSLIDRDYDKIKMKVGERISEFQSALDFNSMSSRHLCSFLKIVFSLQVSADGQRLSRQETTTLLIKTIMADTTQSASFTKAIKLAKALTRVIEDDECAPVAAAVMVPLLALYSRIQIDIGKVQIVSMKQLVTALGFMAKLSQLFVDAKSTRSIKVTDELEIGLSFKHVQDEGAETVLVNEKVLLETDLKQWLLFDIESSKHALHAQAREFVAQMASRFKTACGFEYSSFKLGDVDPEVELPDRDKWEFNFLDQLSNIKPKRQFAESTTDLYLKDDVVSRLSQCTLHVCFVTAASYKREEGFQDVLSQYLQENLTNITLILSVDKGIISVCSDSYLPNLIKTLTSHEKSVFQIDYTGLLTKLSSIPLANLPNQDLIEYCFENRCRRRLQPPELASELQADLDKCFERFDDKIQHFFCSPLKASDGFVLAFKVQGDAARISVESVTEETVKEPSEMYKKYIVKFAKKKDSGSLCLITVNFN